MMMPRILLTFSVIVASGLLGHASPISTNGTLPLENLLTRTGQATWFNVGLGSCGENNVNSDLIVAIAASLYDLDHAGNCNQWVKITANGKTAYGLTRDRCVGCGEGDLDLSPALFQKFAPLDQGVIKGISWNFEPKDSQA